MDVKKEPQGADPRIDREQSFSQTFKSAASTSDKIDETVNEPHQSHSQNDKVVTPPEHGESPSAPTSETRKGSSRNLIANLGFDNWPHSDEALVQALAVKSEHERTKQEFFRFESHKRILEIFQKAEALGVPGTALPAMFGINDEVAKSAFTTYTDQRRGSEFSTPKQPYMQQQQQQQQQQRFQQSQAPQKSQITPQLGVPASQQPQQPQQQRVAPHSRQESVYSSPSNINTSLAGFPGPIAGPQSPSHVDANATIPSPGALVPTGSAGNTSDFGTSTPLSHRAQGRPDFNQHSFPAKQGSPEKFVPGHRATVSAMPALGATAQPLYAPSNPYLSQSPTTPLVSPTVANPYRGPAPGVGAGVPQYNVPHLLPPMDPQVQHALEQEQHNFQQQQAQQLQQAQHQVQQAQQAQVQVDQQAHMLKRNSGQFTPYSRASQPAGVAQQPPLNVVTQQMPAPQQQQQSPVQSSPLNQPMVPVMGFTPAYRPSPTRRTHHRASLSTGSDLQIHQWKPKQLLRDNRWKLANPFKAKERRAGEAAQAAAAHQSVNNPPPNTQNNDYNNSAETNQNASLSDADNSSKAPPPKQVSRGGDAGGSSPQRAAQDNSSSSSAAVVAAHNNRRRSANHVRRRSAAMFSPDVSINDTPSSEQASHVHPQRSQSQTNLHEQPQQQQQHQQDIVRRDEGVAVLASLATEQGRRDSSNNQSSSQSSQSPTKEVKGEPGPVGFSNPQ